MELHVKITTRTGWARKDGTSIDAGAQMDWCFSVEGPYATVSCIIQHTYIDKIEIETTAI